MLAGGDGTASDASVFSVKEEPQLEEGEDGERVIGDLATQGALYSPAA